MLIVIPVVLVTEWKRFRQPDFDAMKDLMKSPVVFDGRNQYVPETLTEYGFVYHAIGRSNRPGALSAREQVLTTTEPAVLEGA